MSTFNNFQRTAELLGGQEVFRRTPTTALEAHDLLVEGLPNLALLTLFTRLVILETRTSLQKTIGVSMRSVRRRKMKSEKLSQEQSVRLWKFAEVLSKATHVFGSQREAEEWLQRPAIGLEQLRPIDLLATPPGLELVEDYLAIRSK